MKELIFVNAYTSFVVFIHLQNADVFFKIVASLSVISLNLYIFVKKYKEKK